MTDDHGRTAMHYACMGSRAAVLTRLLTEPRLHCARDRDIYGFTPLMYAAMKRGSTRVIRTMIADVYQGRPTCDLYFYLCNIDDLERP